MKPFIGGILYLLSAVAVLGIPGKVHKCADKKYDENSVVCVCNSTYCDSLGIVKPPAPGNCLHFESNMAGLRLESQSCIISEGKGASGSHILKVIVDPLQGYQEILGFGGAITDAVGINIASLSLQTQKKLLRQYFGPEGIGYTFIRLPLGASDFSTGYYSYDDHVNDTTLSHFGLTQDDYKYKIPFVKQAMALSTTPVKLLTSMWKIPEWMTEPRYFVHLPGLARLKFSYYQLLADYIVRYLDNYKKEGLEFWGLSSHNEPLSSFFLCWVPSVMGWTPQEQACFLGNYLLPTLRAKGYDYIKLFLLDDQRCWINYLLSDLEDYPDVLKSVAGVAVHWYLNHLFSPNVLVDIKNRFPNWTIISTEAAIIPWPFTKAVHLGEWQNAEKYAWGIMEDLNHGVAAWIDWNMVLDTVGGPSYINNYLDSAIIVNASADEFYKQPVFYAMAHFSKFVPSGSIRMDLSMHSYPNVQGIAFLTPEHTLTTVLANGNSRPVKVQLYVRKVGRMDITLSAHSISTVICNKYTEAQR